MRKWRKRYPNRAAYSAFRTNAWRRGIEFRITLTEFTRWCRDNGYLKLRGMGADDMTIGRKDHYQPYTIGNIMMETKSENGKKGKPGKRPYYRPDGVPF
jgi:hypothetical protein